MSTTNLFSNCTNHYPIEQYFLNCTNTSRPCELIHDFAVVAELLTILDFYISCILFTIAGILNVYFMTIVLPLYLKMSHSTQKRYVFVVSRCVSSISAALTLLILRCILYVYFPPGSTKSNYFLYAVVVIVNDISFYSLQGIYYYKCKVKSFLKLFWIQNKIWISGMIQRTTCECWWLSRMCF